ncbi:MAG TPA: glycosyltransferase [Solirubrobacterales bacterium]|nr:glycosyltransferase [Solirubrobacterales bacterium]
MSERPTPRTGPVLWLHSHFLLPTGGTKYIYEVVRRLAERRPVEVIVERASDYWKERYAAAGVPLHEISKSTSTSKLYWLGFPRNLRGDRAAIDDLIERTDASALVSSFFPMNQICVELGQKHSLRHSHLCFEPFPFFHDREVTGLYPLPNRILMGVLAMLYGRIDEAGVRGADALLTLNKVTAGSIERVYGRSDAIPVYTGVDLDFFHPYGDDELADLRAKHGDGPLAIHSTDFSPIKRTDLALAAFAAAAVPGSKLLITSTIDDRGGLEAMMSQARDLGIEDQTKYLGFVDYEDLPRYYSLADVLLQTGTSVNSGATSMSLPVKEALACGTAVIRSHATDEDVDDGVSGYLVDPADSATTGTRLAELLGDRSRARAFGEAGRGKIAELYRWDRVVDLVERSLSDRPAPIRSGS